MSRLAAPRRRNRFVILQAVRSPPVALHPTSLRRSYLRLHVSRLHIGRTFTLLTRQHHRRTHSRVGGNPGPRHVRPSLDARFRGHDTGVSESSPHFSKTHATRPALGRGYHRGFSMLPSVGCGRRTRQRPAKFEQLYPRSAEFGPQTGCAYSGAHWLPFGTSAPGIFASKTSCWARHCDVP